MNGPIKEIINAFLKDNAFYLALSIVILIVLVLLLSFIFTRKKHH